MTIGEMKHMNEDAAEHWTYSHHIRKVSFIINIRVYEYSLMWLNTGRRRNMTIITDRRRIQYTSREILKMK